MGKYQKVRLGVWGGSALAGILAVVFPPAAPLLAAIATGLLTLPLNVIPRDPWSDDQRRAYRERKAREAEGVTPPEGTKRP